MKVVFIFALLTVMSIASHAQPRRAAASVGNYEHEISTNLTRGSFQSGKACKSCDSGSVLDIGGSYLNSWSGLIQLGGEGRLRLLSKETSASGKSETLFDLVGVGVYNFSSDFKNALYTKAGIGFYSAIDDQGTANGYTNKLGLFVGAGKRFEWMSNISYSPELRLVKIGDIDLGIQIDLLNFAVSW